MLYIFDILPQLKQGDS